MLRQRLAVVERLLADTTVTVYESGDEAGWPTRLAGETATRRALTGEERPTAIVAMDDVLALGALDAIHRLGLETPTDVSVAGIGDVTGSDLAGLTTVMVPYRPMGELAGEMLAARVGGGDSTAMTAPLPTALVVRRTTGAPPV